MARAGIRVADGARDLALAAALRRAMTAEQDGPVDDPGFETRFAAWWDEESTHRTTWIASVDDRPVGLCALTEFRRMPRPGRPSGRWGYLANLFVLAPHRDAGIGRQLLDVALAEARQRRYERVVLRPSPRSVPFYRRQGFTDAADGLLVRAMPARVDGYPADTGR